MSNSLGSHMQHTFDSYCKKVIRNEARNIKKQKSVVNSHQTSLSIFPEDSLDKLFYIDNNFDNSNEIKILNNTIKIVDSFLFNAINHLTENKKMIVLLFYFYGFNDREIAEINHMSVSGIWYQRQMAIKEMKKFLEVEYYE